MYKDETFKAKPLHPRNGGSFNPDKMFDHWNREVPKDPVLKRQFRKRQRRVNDYLANEGQE